MKYEINDKVRVVFGDAIETTFSIKDKEILNNSLYGIVQEIDLDEDYVCPYWVDLYNKSQVWIESYYFLEEELELYRNNND